MGSHEAISEHRILPPRILERGKLDSGSLDGVPQMEVLGTCDNGRVVCRDFLDRIYEGFGLRGTNLISSSDHVFDFRTSHRRMARKFAGEWVTMGPFLWGWTPLFRVRESGNNFRLSFYPKLGRTGQWLLFRVAIGVVVSPCKATPCYPIRWHVA